MQNEQESGVEQLDCPEQLKNVPWLICSVKITQSGLITT